MKTIAMRFPKILFFLVVPLLIELVAACCDCPEPVLKQYTHKTFAVTELDNSQADAMESPTDTIDKNALGIRLMLEYEKLAMAIPLRFRCMNTAVAFSCRCPPETAYEPKDSITSLKIYTLFDFDNTHPGGSDITEYFFQYKNNSYLAIVNIMHALNSTLRYENDFNQSIDLLLMHAPPASSNQQFQVILDLSDGRQITLTTAKIWLV